MIRHFSIKILFSGQIKSLKATAVFTKDEKERVYQENFSSRKLLRITSTVTPTSARITSARLLKPEMAKMINTSFVAMENTVFI